MSVRFVRSTIDQYAIDYVYYLGDDGAAGWFVPFQNQRANVVELLDQSHLLAIGSKDRVTIFDTATGHRTLTSKGFGHLTAYHPRCVSRVKPALYIACEADRLNTIRELAFDGSVDRVIPVSSLLHALRLGVRHDGAILAYGVLDPSFGVGCTGFLVVDPRTGAVEVEPLRHFRSDYDWGSARTGLNWFSPSGEHVLRLHVGSVPRHAPSVRTALASVFGTRPTFAGHPDIVDDGRTRFGIALDVYRTSPFALAQRLVTRFVTQDDIDKYSMSQGWSATDSTRIFSVFNQLANAVDYATWDGKSQLLFASLDESDADTRKQIEQRDFHATFLIGLIKEVVWAQDGQALTVCYRDGVQRTVSLSGEIGPLEKTPVLEWLEIPRSVAKAVRKQLRDRHELRIPLTGIDEGACIAAIEAMTQLIDRGLKHIVHRDNLTFVFVRADDTTLNEEEFFARVGANCPAAVPALRALMLSYGRQAAGALTWEGGEQISTGSDPENERTALAYAALALAKLDPRAHEILAEWFDSVDQEHDGFAAHQVFPTMIETSGWSAPDFVEFALRFVMRHYQTLQYDLREVGLLQTLRQHWSAADFASAVAKQAAEWKAARRKYVGFENDTLEALSQNIVMLLDDTVPWDRLARRELAFALRTAQGTGPWGTAKYRA